MNEQGLAEPTPVPHRERITIALLMLWTAMSAVLLAVDRATDIGEPNRLAWASKLYAFFYAPLFGAGVTAFLLMVWRVMQRGPRIPSQPGHWLLVIGGVLGLCIVLVRFVVLFTTDKHDFLASYSRYFAMRLLILPLSLVLFYFARRSAHDHWRPVFTLCMWLPVVTLVSLAVELFHLGPRFFASRVEFVLAWIVTLSIAIAALRDWQKSIPRDDLHWAGVFIRFAHQLSTTSLGLLLPYIQQWNSSS